MSEIRSARRAATRDALARAAARLDLDNRLSLDTLTEQVGVSRRTVHNYFPRLTDALRFYSAYCVANFVEKLEATSSQTPMAALEEAAISTNCLLELHYVCHSLTEDSLRQPVVAWLADRFPELNLFQCQVYLAAASGVIEVVLQQLPAESAPELFHSAFGQLKH